MHSIYYCKYTYCDYTAAAVDSTTNNYFKTSISINTAASTDSSIATATNVDLSSISTNTVTTTVTTTVLVLPLKPVSYHSEHFRYPVQLLMSSMYRHTSHHKRSPPPHPPSIK